MTDCVVPARSASSVWLSPARFLASLIRWFPLTTKNIAELLYKTESGHQAADRAEEAVLLGELLELVGHLGTGAGEIHVRDRQVGGDGDHLEGLLDVVDVAGDLAERAAWWTVPRGG